MNEARKILGNTLFSAALRLSRLDATSNKWNERYTLVSAADAIGKRRTPKRYTKGHAVAVVRDTAERLYDLRCKSHKGHRHGSDPLLVPVAERLSDRIYHGAAAAIRCNLRQYARQVEPDIGRSSFADACIVLNKEEGWISYTDKSRQGVVSAEYAVALGPGWFSLPSWLRSCDGLLTVAAIRLDADERDGETVYRAKWAKNVQGGVETVSGFIVRYRLDGREYTAHGRTLGTARATITRQLPEWVAAADERSRKRAERLERIKTQIVKRLDAGKMNGYADIEVTFADSRRAGNCSDGAQHWAELHFPGRDSVTVAEVVEVEDQRERVLLACAAAVRRAVPSAFAID